MLADALSRHTQKNRSDDHRVQTLLKADSLDQPIKAELSFSTHPHRPDSTDIVALDHEVHLID